MRTPSRLGTLLLVSALLLAGCSPDSDAGLSIMGLAPNGAGTRAMAVAPTARQFVNTAATRCLSLRAEASNASERAVLAACDPTAEDSWWELPAVGAIAQVKGANGVCLTAAGTQNGSTVASAACANTSAQKWLLTGNGQLQLNSTKRCLVSLANVTADGAALVLGACGSKTASWRVGTEEPNLSASTVPVAPTVPPVTAVPVDSSLLSVALDSAAQLVNDASSRCLNVAFREVAPGAKVILWECGQAGSNEFWSTAAAGKAGAVRVYGTMCLVPPAVATDGLTIANCDASGGQRWTRTAAGQFRHDATGKCLATAGGATDNGTPAALGECTVASAQWRRGRLESSSAPDASAPSTALPAPSEPTNGALPVAPELPRDTVSVAPVVSTGRTIAVVAGGDLQAAIDAAQPGDVITLAAGATYTGNYVLPVKTGTGWIVIRSATTASAGRMTPTKAQAERLPKIHTPNAQPAIATQPGAHHYRLVGLEVGPAPGLTFGYALVQLGDGGAAQDVLSEVPHHFVFEKMYMHGNDNYDFRRCLLLNSASTAVFDSWLSECHARGADSQAIAGWNGPGPFRIENNYLEGAGENVMFGGADASIPNLVPSDITFRRNHVTKPLSWVGGPWSVKNLLELKNARRVLIEGNVFENALLGAHGGFALVWKSVNQDGSAPWSTTSDVTAQYNLLRRVGGVLNLAGHPESHPVVPAARFKVAHNLFEQVGDPVLQASSPLFQLATVANVEIAHNTGVQPNRPAVYFVGDPAPPSLLMRDNIIGGEDVFVSSDGKGIGSSAFNYHTPSWIVRGNVVLGGVSVNPLTYPGGNLYAATPAAAGLTADLQVTGAPLTGTQGTSLTTDGAMPGVDRTTLASRISGVVIAP